MKKSINPFIPAYRQAGVVKFVSSLIRLFVFVSLVALVLGCGQQTSNTSVVPSSPELKLEIEPASPAIVVGEKVQFKLKGLENNASEEAKVAWNVIGDIGTIDATGLFSAIKVGVGSIEAKYNDFLIQSSIEVISRKISGTVYDFYASNIYTNSLVPLGGATIYVNQQVATSDATGSFSVSENSTGEIKITAFKKDYNYISLVTDKSNIKVFLFPKQYSRLSKGDATYTGTIKGLPAGVNDVYGHAISSMQYYQEFSFDQSSNSYTLKNAPAGNETYLFIYYYDQGQRVYTYKKFNPLSGINNIDLEFGPFNIAKVSILVPSGYKTSYIYSYICNRNQIIMDSSYEQLNGKTDFIITRLPQLQNGDNYGLHVSAKDEIAGDTVRKYIYDLDIQNPIAIDLSLMPRLKFKDPTPVNDSIITVPLTIAWEPVGEKDVFYSVYIYSDWNAVTWTGYTKGTSITVPDAFTFKPATKYYIFLTAGKIDEFDIADFSSIRNSKSEYGWNAPDRAVYYETKGGVASSQVSTKNTEKFSKDRNFYEQILFPGIKNE